MNILNQLISLILPITVLIIIPVYIEQNFKIHSVSTLILGLIFILTGLILLVLTISALIRIGKGALAPWIPTKKLVVIGIYSHVRNPMITGVLSGLIGESILFSSLNIFAWAVIFFIINNIYFSLFEEPGLRNRFGDEYLEYKRNVPRWIPKRNPYKTN